MEETKRTKHPSYEFMLQHPKTNVFDYNHFLNSLLIVARTKNPTNNYNADKYTKNETFELSYNGYKKRRKTI